MTEPPPDLIARLRALPRPVWLLCLGTFINKFGSFVVPFLILYLTRNGYSTAQAGIAIGAYGVGNLLASLAGGWLADRIGRRNTIVLSMFSGALAMLALSQARGFPAICILTALTGLTSELYRPASSALLADLVPEGQRVTAFALYRLALNAGFAFGPATAGFLAKQSFFWLFIGDAATSALFGIVALATLPHGLRHGAGESGWGEAFKAARADRPFLVFLAASFAISLVFFQMSSTFALQVGHAGFSDATFGVLISLNGLFVVLLELPLTSLTQRRSARKMMAFGYALMGGGFALVALATTVPALVGTVLVWTLGEIFAFPVAGAFIADLAPPALRGRYMGLWGLTGSLALVIGPSLGAALFARSPTLVWIACGALGLLAAGIILIKPESGTTTTSP